MYSEPRVSHIEWRFLCDAPRNYAEMGGKCSSWDDCLGFPVERPKRPIIRTMPFEGTVVQEEDQRHVT